VNGKSNLGASVSARLLNQAKRSGADYQTLLTTYCLERFLYRLGAFRKYAEIHSPGPKRGSQRITLPGRKMFSHLPAPLLWGGTPGVFDGREWLLMIPTPFEDSGRATQREGRVTSRKRGG
jgi:hypothetical protein